ncbi:uncharacterized LabA/DUF88 family protein [Diaminobutyricimonas aerilata]|uniref:Uncharacterized LabA/DUF88 family protein n=1 Tax=Diaminobutyricimonas aerilata TaxID=1162967 RepID=A0A2M9CPC3_9MICO|nr:NYN domain-containing protein [Diaminobutyricimonas aerilata]PJJ73708.1 uncharacterized LabA/DUF88 family protein [Diaminobutyricimonas aerilata]
MAETAEARVGVYIDFDNIVISRYDQRNGRSSWQRDHARDFDPRSDGESPVAKRLEESTVDLGAILDFASSFGPIAVSRAYADWSVPINASYRAQLIARAVELVQLFPLTAGMKNGADIRLAVDVVEDLFRLSDLTHVVIVAGDSDYVALAQRCRMLGRYVVGVGVAGSTSSALANACDRFADYDAIPGVAAASRRREADEAAAAAEPAQPTRRRRARSRTPHELASDLLVRAIELLQDKNDDEWQGSGAVKNQMLRMDPSFQERALGFRSFGDFVQSLDAVELDESHPSRRLRVKSRP